MFWNQITWTRYDLQLILKGKGKNRILTDYKHRGTKEANESWIYKLGYRNEMGRELTGGKKGEEWEGREGNLEDPLVHDNDSNIEGPPLKDCQKRSEHAPLANNALFHQSPFSGNRHKEEERKRTQIQQPDPKKFGAPKMKESAGNWKRVKQDEEGEKDGLALPLSAWFVSVCVFLML